MWHGDHTWWANNKKVPLVRSLWGISWSNPRRTFICLPNFFCHDDEIIVLWVQLCQNLCHALFMLLKWLVTTKSKSEYPSFFPDRVNSFEGIKERTTRKDKRESLPKKKHEMKWQYSMLLLLRKIIFQATVTFLVFGGKKYRGVWIFVSPSSTQDNVWWQQTHDKNTYHESNTERVLAMMIIRCKWFALAREEVFLFSIC